MPSPVTKPVISYEHRSNGPSPQRVANDPNTFEVTSPFGPRDIILPNGVRTTSAHGALDIANGHAGDQVVAPWAGHVVAEGFLKWPWSEPTNDFFGGNYGGLMAVVEHPNGLLSLFAHLNQTVISAGDDLPAGGLIGYIGQTGSAVGSPHLHWALIRATVSSVIAAQRVKNEWLVDPWPYLSGQALPDTAVEAELAIPLREKYEEWIVRKGAAFYTDGPGVGNPKFFSTDEEVVSCFQSVDGQWRILRYNGEGLWMNREDGRRQGWMDPKVQGGDAAFDSAVKAAIERSNMDAAVLQSKIKSGLAAAQAADADLHNAITALK